MKTQNAHSQKLKAVESEKKDDLAEQKTKQALLSSAISLHLKLDQSFKLFSFRIINPETFIESVKTDAMDWFEESGKILKDFGNGKD